MAFLSIREIIDIVIITAALGYIFSDVFKSALKRYPEDFFYTRRFDWNSFKFAAIITAPAVILHEFGHKFTAIYFGANATFHAAYFWLGLGVILKLLNTGFIFFVPAYVSHSPASTLNSTIIAFMGPAVNLVLWLSAEFLIRSKIKMKERYRAIVFFTSRVNMFLFIFNMLPLPGFDGYWVLKGIINILF